MPPCCKTGQDRKTLQSPRPSAMHRAYCGYKRRLPQKNVANAPRNVISHSPYSRLSTSSHRSAVRRSSSTLLYRLLTVFHDPHTLLLFYVSTFTQSPSLRPDRMARHMGAIADPVHCPSRPYFLKIKSRTMRRVPMLVMPRKPHHNFSYLSRPDCACIASTTKTSFSTAAVIGPGSPQCRFSMLHAY